MVVRVAVRSGLAVGAVALYAGVASLSRPFTAAAVVAVAVPLGIVLVRSRRRRPAVPDVPLRRTAVAWGAVLGLATVVELVAFVRQPGTDLASPALPTLSVLLDPLTSAGPTRFLRARWLWAGWELARR